MIPEAGVGRGYGGIWVVPRPYSVIEARMHDDAMVIVRRHSNPEGPRLVLSHGNGLAIDLYYPFWVHFLEDFDVLMFDLRNHGWNPVGDFANHNLPVFVRDLGHIMDAIDRHYGSKPGIGIFHSITVLASLQTFRVNLDACK